MPVKNAGRFLEECVSSIIEQSYTDWELIAVDDHSKDISFELIQQFAMNDSRIRLVKNNGDGIIDAFTQAFKLSSGDLISRMDADDVMPRGKLEKLISLVSDKIVATGKVRYFSEDEVSEGYLRYENWLNSLNDKDHIKHIYRECTVASPNWLIKRDFFENEFDWAEWNYPEDYDLLFHWKKAGYEIRMLDSVTHFWREHENRISRNSLRYQQESFFELKTNWFIDFELEIGEEVQLIGSEKKAFLVAMGLRSRAVNFTQFSYKAKVNFFDLDNLNPELKTILTNWPKDQKTQIEISEYLRTGGFVFGENIWLF